MHHPKLCNSISHNNYKDLLEMNVVLNPKQVVKTVEKKKIQSNKEQQYKRASSVPLNNYSDEANSVDLSNRSSSPSASINSNYDENIARDIPSFDYLNEADLKELLRRLQAEYTQLVL